MKVLLPYILHFKVLSYKDSLATTTSGVKICSVLVFQNALLMKLNVMYEYFCIYVLLKGNLTNCVTLDGMSVHLFPSNYFMGTPSTNLSVINNTCFK